MCQWLPMNAKKNVQDRLHPAIESGEDMVADLHCNKGKNHKIEEFWQLTQFLFF